MYSRFFVCLFLYFKSRAWTSPYYGIPSTPVVQSWGQVCASSRGHLTMSRDSSDCHSGKKRVLPAFSR